MNVQFAPDLARDTEEGRVMGAALKKFGVF